MLIHKYTHEYRIKRTHICYSHYTIFHLQKQHIASTVSSLFVSYLFTALYNKSTQEMQPWHGLLYTNTANPDWCTFLSMPKYLLTWRKSGLSGTECAKMSLAFSVGWLNASLDQPIEV